MASKRRLRRKACGSKLRHPTMPDAMLAAKLSSKKFNQRLSAYKCQYCGGFHVGHTPKSIKRFTVNPNTSF